MNKEQIIKLAKTADKLWPDFDVYKDLNYIIGKRNTTFFGKVLENFGIENLLVLAFACTDARKNNISIEDAYDNCIKNLSVIFYAEFGYMNGFTVCKECGGDGIITCLQCDGLDEECHVCNGSGETECLNCDDGFNLSQPHIKININFLLISDKNIIEEIRRIIKIKRDFSEILDTNKDNIYYRERYSVYEYGEYNYRVDDICFKIDKIYQDTKIPIEIFNFNSGDIKIYGDNLTSFKIVHIDGYQHIDKLITNFYE